MSKPTLREIADKLGALGSADAIALFLESEQIKGMPGAAHSCAIARYVQRETGESVGACQAYLMLDSVSNEGPPDDREGCVVLNHYPKGVQPKDEYRPIVEFIDRFDGELYPNLITNTFPL